MSSRNNSRRCPSRTCRLSSPRGVVTGNTLTYRALCRSAAAPVALTAPIEPSPAPAAFFQSQRALLRAPVHAAEVQRLPSRQETVASDVNRGHPGLHDPAPRGVVTPTPIRRPAAVPVGLTAPTGSAPAPVVSSGEKNGAPSAPPGMLKAFKSLQLVKKQLPAVSFEVDIQLVTKYPRASAEKTVP